MNVEKYLVKNWCHWWKWFSTWAFALIIFLATVPVPPEVMAIIPQQYRDKLIIITAIAGFILRFINQSPNKNYNHAPEE